MYALPTPFYAHEFVASLQLRDDNHRQDIANLAQRSDEWFRERFGRLTASNFGAAAGHHLSGAKTKALKSMVWPEFSALTGRAAEFAAYGTAHEDVARRIYVAHRSSTDGDTLFSVSETGLVVSLEHGWLAASPDFLVKESASSRLTTLPPPEKSCHLHAPFLVDNARALSWTSETKPKPEPESEPEPEPKPELEPESEPVEHVRGCGEIKCPATRTLYSSNPKHSKHGFPEYYYDQIQGAMAILDVPWCDVVVYTPQNTEVTRFARDVIYWDTQLFPALKAFYFGDFLPRLIMRACGALKPGEIDPVCAPIAGLTTLGQPRAKNETKAGPKTRHRPKTKTKTKTVTPKVLVWDFDVIDVTACGTTEEGSFVSLGE